MQRRGRRHSVTLVVYCSLDKNKNLIDIHKNHNYTIYQKDYCGKTLILSDVLNISSRQYGNYSNFSLLSSRKTLNG